MWNGFNFQVVDTGGIVFDDTVDVFASDNAPIYLPLDSYREDQRPVSIRFE